MSIRQRIASELKESKKRKAGRPVRHRCSALRGSMFRCFETSLGMLVCVLCGCFCACVCVCVLHVDSSSKKKVRESKDTKGQKGKRNKSIRGGDRTPDLERVKLTS